MGFFFFLPLPPFWLSPLLDEQLNYMEECMEFAKHTGFDSSEGPV
jgi:hypothetical protein